METIYVREFLVMAEICNYTTAADDLFITQSTLFKHIKSLEAEIGESLFVRKGKHIILSRYGQKFIPYARQILRLTEQFMRDIEDEHQKAASILTIGSQYRITELLQTFRKEHPNVLLHTSIVGSVESLLGEAGCELAFIRGLDDPGEKYGSLLYIKETMAAVLYKEHPLADRQAIRLTELSEEDFIVIPPLWEDPYSAINLCQNAGFTPRVVMTADSGIEVARLVGQSLGISILFKNVIANMFIDNTVVIDLDPIIESPVYLCWKKGAPLTDGAKLFIEFIKTKSRSIISVLE